MTRALFIPFGPLGRVGEMVQRRKWTPTEFTVSGKTGRGEVPKAAQHPRGVATASPKTVSGSLRVGGEQANNNATPHNFTQRQRN